MQKHIRTGRKRTTNASSRRMLFRSDSTLKRSLQLGFLGLFFVATLWGGLYFYQQHLQAVPQGVSLLGVDFSGVRRHQAKNFLQQMAREWEKRPLEVVVSENGMNKQVKKVSVSDIGLSLDPAETLTLLFGGSIGQAEVMGVHASAGSDLSPSLFLDRTKWRETLEWARGFQKPVRDADILFDEASQQWVLQESQVGLALLETDEVFLRDQLLSGGLETSLEFVMERIDPLVKTEDIQPLFEKIQTLLSRSFEWVVNGEAVGFSLAKSPRVIVLDMQRRSVGIDRDFLHSLLSEWAQNFNSPAGAVVVGESVLQEKGYLKAEYSGEFVSGRMLDEEKIFQQILAEEFSQDVLELPFVSLSPDVELSGVGKLALLSQGRSSYALAHGEEREFNVRFGLSKYDGVVIPQGKEFDFNQILGWVTYEAGWKPALAIFGGGGVKPVPGGGLCQVSTTMYRAVVNSGLPVTARKPHSLDVSYYQQYGYGIDSTIYPPEDINLKFMNDTPGPLFIHTWMDEVNKEAFIDFYGIDDGRKIDIRQVVNREVRLPNQITPAADIPTGMQEVLQKGRTGRYIEWEWNITRADGSVEKRTIETLYPAAARVVRVGTGG